MLSACIKRARTLRQLLRARGDICYAVERNPEPRDVTKRIAGGEWEKCITTLHFIIPLSLFMLTLLRSRRIERRTLGSELNKRINPEYSSKLIFIEWAVSSSETG